MMLAMATTAFLLSRVGKNAGAKSLPDFMGIRFNSSAMRLITAIFTIVMLWYIAAQLVGIAYVFTTAMGLSYVTALVIAGVVIAVYMVIGGTHADILNCFVQGILMSIFGATVVALVFIHVGGIGAIESAVTAIDPAFSSSIVFKDPWMGPFTGPAIFLAITLFALSPQLSKMWLALDDERHVPRTLLYMMGFGMILAFMLFWIGGLGSKALFPDIRPDLGTVTIITTFLPPPAAAALLLGVVSAVMSTAAGLYLVMAVAFSTDIYRDSIVPRLKSRPPEDVLDKRSLRITRILIPIIMGVGILIALRPPEYLTGLMWIGLGAFVAGVIPPMIVSCLWRGVTKTAAIAASITGLSIHMISYFVFGVYLEIPICLVPWFGCGIGLIVSFILTFAVSAFTEPPPKEYLDKLFAKN